MNLIFAISTAIFALLGIYGVNYYSVSKKCYIYMTSCIVLLTIIFIERYESYLLPGVGVVVFYFLYREIRNFHALIITCISFVILFITNALMSIIILGIFNMSIEVFRESTLIYCINCLIGGILAYLLGCLFKKFAIKNIKEYSMTFKDKSYVYIVMLLVLTVTMFYVNVVLFTKSVNIISGWQIGVEIGMCTIYGTLLYLIYRALIQSIKNDFELKARDKEYKNIKEYTENLENIYSEMRGFRHDYINILSSMVGYIEMRDIDGLKNYFNNNIVKLNEEMEKRNTQIGILQNIDIPEIKGLISSKLIKAQEKGIDVKIEVMDKILSIDIDIVHLCRVLGILIDNAIEECEKSEIKEIKFAIVKKKNTIIIVVSNTCSENVPPIFQLYKKGFSTKGEGRGLGLSNIKEILNIYPKVTLETKIIEKEFIQCIEI